MSNTEALNKVYANLCLRLGDTQAKIVVLQDKHNKEMTALQEQVYLLQTQIKSLNELTPSITTAYEQTPQAPTPKPD